MSVQVTWRPLELPNLPGAPTRRPGFNSPYHYRLSWETWISTTASMEQVVERRIERDQRRGAAAAAVAGGDDDDELPIPSHLSTLIGKVRRLWPDGARLRPRSRPIASDGLAGAPTLMTTDDH